MSVLEWVVDTPVKLLCAALSVLLLMAGVVEWVSVMHSTGKPRRPPKEVKRVRLTREDESLISLVNIAQKEAERRERKRR